MPSVLPSFRIYLQVVPQLIEGGGNCWGNWCPPGSRWTQGEKTSRKSRKKIVPQLVEDGANCWGIKWSSWSMPWRTRGVSTRCFLSYPIRHLLGIFFPSLGMRVIIYLKGKRTTELELEIVSPKGSNRPPPPPPPF